MREVHEARGTREGSDAVDGQQGHTAWTHLPQRLLRSGSQEGTVTNSFDVVVVGAGTAGAWAASQFANAGRRVALVERKALHDAGAHWVNGVAPWMLQQAGVSALEGAEDRGVADAFIMASFEGAGRVEMRPAPLRHVDMRHLSRRIQESAVAAGVHIFDQTVSGHLTCENGRPVALDTAGEHGDRRLEARLFVDASGMAGVLRRQVPAFQRWCPPIARGDICSAAQQVHAVADPDGAEAWMAQHRVHPGETLSFVSVAGGFSTLGVYVGKGYGYVEVLTGTVPTAGVPTGKVLADRFVRANPWVGERVFGGAGAIPLRRAWDRLAVPGLALVGDAACQVFPGHGSGVGPGLVAANHLAHAARSYDDPGCLDATWRYQANYQRDIGAVCAAYGVFRRMTQGFSSADSAAVLTAGLLTETMAAAALRQQMAMPKPLDLVQTIAGLARQPRLAAQLAPAAFRMQAVHALYRRYPLSPHEPALNQWAGRVAVLFGEVGSLGRALRG